jgi:hypothetical protein
MNLIDNPPGGYRFLTGIAPYSSGVVALPGFEVAHATLHTPLPYREGFALVERYLAGLGRPRQALCAIELRIPQPLSFAGFAAFNAEYGTLLAEWGLLVEGRNPLARTNVAPALRPPAEPVLHGFGFTIARETAGDAPTFIGAGAGELVDQAQLDATAIVRPGETSPEAMAAKARVVMDVMQARLDGLGVGWQAVTALNVYTAQPLEPLLEAEIFARAARPHAHEVVWHYSRPPIAGLEFEMDLRGTWREVRL